MNELSVGVLWIKLSRHFDCCCNKVLDFDVPVTLLPLTDVDMLWGELSNKLITKYGKVKWVATNVGGQANKRLVLRTLDYRSNTSPLEANGSLDVLLHSCKHVALS